MTEPLERTITSSILRALRLRGGWWAKIPGTRMSAGLPDIIGLEEGTFYGMEVKRPSTRDNVTPLQQKVLEKISAAGGVTAVVTSVKEALALVSGVESAESAQPE